MFLTVVASGSLDNTIRLWDVTAGTETGRLEGHSLWVAALCMLPDGRLASGSHADRYLLATLKYVRLGQPVEVAFDLYPGQIFRGRVDSIWKANGSGQYLPSDEIPKFHPLAPDIPQGQYAVKILLDDSDPSKFPIRRASLRRNLHEQGYGSVGGVAQDFDPRAFVVQLALSDAVLKQISTASRRHPAAQGAGHWRRPA